MKLEDYALIGDLRTSALVGTNGSIDWLCLPRVDSAACFAALLGTEDNGRWVLSPSGRVRGVSRHYREGTLILETDFETDTGTARVIDFMPLRDGGAPQLVRIVQGLPHVVRDSASGSALVLSAAAAQGYRRRSR